MGVIIGRVVDNKSLPIPDVKVGIIRGSANYPDLIALTDSNGEYDLDNIPNGSFEVNASKENFITQTKTIKIISDEENKLDFVLLPND